MFLRLLTALLLIGATAAASLAQGTKADYQRAAQIRRLTAGKVLNEHLDPKWLPDGERFWYRRQLSEGRHEFIFVDAKSGTRQRAFDHRQLAKALSAELKREMKPGHLPVEGIDVAADGIVHFNAAGRSFTFNSGSRELTKREEKLPKPLSNRKGRNRREPWQRDARREDRSPDGRWRVRLEDGRLVARGEEGGERIEFDRGEKFPRADIYWSPDSRCFVAMQRTPEQEHRIHMVESSPRDQVQPKLKSRQYLKPGDRIEHFRPRLFNVAARREVPVDDALFANPWEINRVRWAADSSRFTFIYNQRGHGVLRLISVDADSGSVRTIVEDAPGTFVDYAHKQFAYFLDDTGQVIWMSERDGWNHLYRFDVSSGEQCGRLTSGEWVVRGIDRVDEENRQLWFRACGIVPGEDPYHVHYCRVDFDGTNLVRLTAGDGTHEVRFSPDGRYLIDRYSRVDLPPVIALRRVNDGSLVCELESADISGLRAIPGWQTPERFVAKGRDGETDIWGVIHRPTTLEPDKKYPVIERIYAGPHGQHVPKRFHSYYSSQQISELGFIVVQIDGMGTNWRSKKFHDVCHKNLIDAGFPDRIQWINAAAAKYPTMDLSRVGIYGGSAGGQNTLGGLLLHGDFYHVGVADCGCHDNRMDKIWWNEAWMGELGPHYAENSNVTHAHKLKGKLLLTVGELDSNVDPASTMQVANALIKADKDFDLIVMPGVGHGAGEHPYTARRRQDFFVRHLLGREPREELK